MEAILGIIKRKKLDINPTESEREEIKEWLRELRMVGEQHIEADIQSLFHKEYDEWLNEPSDF